MSPKPDDDRYADYAVWFGFHKGVYPTEGGIRYFLTTLGRNSDAGHETVSVEQGQEIVWVEVQKLNLLLVERWGLCGRYLYSAPRLGRSFALPGWSDPRCRIEAALHLGDENCYQACTPETPRHCLAKDKERRGCDCDSWPVHRCAVKPLRATHRPVSFGTPVPTNPRIVRTTPPTRMQANTPAAKPVMVTVAAFAPGGSAQAFQCHPVGRCASGQRA